MIRSALQYHQKMALRMVLERGYILVAIDGSQLIVAIPLPSLYLHLQQ